MDSRGGAKTPKKLILRVAKKMEQSRATKKNIQRRRSTHTAQKKRTRKNRKANHGSIGSGERRI